MRNSKAALMQVGGGPISTLEGKLANWKNITGKEIYTRYSTNVGANSIGIRESPHLQDALYQMQQKWFD